jgi:hypothetical protein
MMTKASSTGPRHSRSRLLLQGSVLAAAVAFSSSVADHARAQVAPRANTTVAVQGSETIQSGTVTVSRSPTLDTIQVDSPSAIIRWDTFDQATLGTTTDYINFLPAGTEMEFVGVGAEYAVLNRVFGAPDALGNQRGIAFLGNVTSRLSGSGPIGGTIWFYSPGGILVSQTAAFNVGALMLTTSDVSATVDNSGTTIDFLGATQPDSSVVIEAGSVINALNDGSSYLAVFAPRIEQGGDVNVDGSVGYIAGEAGTLRISPNNLFDIAITQGTDDANGIVHTGDTGGPAAGAASDGHGIYFVAVPKNNALTMLLGGGIGYTGASTATVDDGRIILSAGQDVTTTVGTTGPEASFIDNTANPNASIGIQGGTTLRSNTEARAEANLSAISTDTTGAIQFSEGADFIAKAEGLLQVGASNTGGIFSVGGDLDISAGGPDSGGTALLAAVDGGDIFVTGDIFVSSGNATSGGIASIVTTANSVILSNGTVNINAGGGSHGGTANLIAEGGASGIQALAINVNATATGEDGSAANGNIGGDATGGTVNILIGTNQFGVDGAGILQTLNGISADASAFAGSGTAGNGTAQGGTINFQIDSGAIGPIDPAIPGGIALRADGTATSSTGGTTTGGTGIGGTVNIDLNGGTITDGALFASADGTGSQGGDGTGGSITVNQAGATTTLDTLTLTAGGSGGSGQPGEAVLGTVGTAGGLGTGGSVALNATSGTLSVTDAITLAASANTSDGAGEGGSGSGTTGGAGGAGVGGTAAFTLEGNASVTANTIVVSANATGGAGGSTFPEFDTVVTPGGAAGDGGAGTAGTATFDNRSGDLSFGSFTVEANGSGGGGGGNSGITVGDSSAPGGNGGDGIGGTAIIKLEQDDGSDPIYTVTALGDGGDGGQGQDSGSGGAGLGGDAQLNVIDAAVNLTSATINAGATGGDGGFVDGPNGTGGAGGSATGGSALLSVDGATAQFSSDSSLIIVADGLGGSGAFAGFNPNDADPTANGGAGGSGTGGTITLLAQNGGTLEFSLDSTISATGSGGSGGDGGSANLVGTGNGGTGGAGGDGTGGTISLSNPGGGSLVADALSLDASGFGGSPGNGGIGGSGGSPGLGGTGGTGLGGNVTINTEGEIVGLLFLDVLASGTGGSSFSGSGTGVATTGGVGQGGTIDFTISGTGPVLGSLSSMNLDASGTGGAGGPGSFGDAVSDGTAGGMGGAGIGGSVAFGIAGAGASLAFDPATILLSALGTGGAGGAGGGNFSGGTAGDGGTGGDATGGSVILRAASGSTLDLGAIGTLFTLTSEGIGGAGGTGGSIDMVSGGIAGNGGDGGTGTGGSPVLRAIGGTITGLDLQLAATGTGGAGGVGGDDGTVVLGATGNGGTGIGGNPILEVLDGSPGILTFRDVGLFANGVGGAGTIVGGTLAGRVEINDLSPDPLGLITFNSLTVDATGDASTANGGLFMTAGSGAISVTTNVTVDVAGDIRQDFASDGQLVAGGDVALNAVGDIIVTHTGNATPVNSIDAGGTFTAIAGGNFNSGAGTAVNSALVSSVTAQNIAFDQIQSGASITLDAITGSVTSGPVGLLSAAGNVDVTAATTASVGGITTTNGGTATLDAQSIALGASDIAGGLVADATAGDIVSEGIVTVGGGIALTATGDIVFGTLGALGGDFTVDAGGDVLADHAEASGNFIANLDGDFTTGLNSIVTGGDIVIVAANIVDLGNSTAGGLIDVTGSQIDFADLVAGGTIDLLTAVTANTLRGNGNISGATIDAGPGASSIAALGAVQVSGMTTVTGSLDIDAGADIALGIVDVQGGDFTAQAGGAITFGDIVAAGDASLVSTGGGDISGSTLGSQMSISASTAGAFDVLTVVSSGAGGGMPAMVAADNGIAIENLTASNGTLTAVNGPVTVSVDIVMSGPLTASGTSVLLRSAHDLVAQADASAGNLDIATTGALELLGGTATQDILLASGGDLVITDNTVAGGLLSLTAGGLLDVQALAAGTTVSADSNDIAIGSAGSLGRADLTGLIELSTSGDMLVGGDGSATGVWQLDNDEFTRVHSGDDIALAAGGAAELRDLDIVVASGALGAPSGNIGLAGAFSLFSNGGIDITGDVAMTNATADNALNLSTDLDIFLDAETGLLEIADGNGALTGTSFLGATNVYAMTQSALEDIQGLSVTEVDARLADSDGMNNPGGVIRAGTLDITTTGSDVFIQNTVPGTAFDERRGFTVDALVLSDPNSTQPIVINGVIGTATGIDVIGLTAIDSDFDPASTINGCLIAFSLRCFLSVDPDGPGLFDNPIQDLIDSNFDRDDPTGDTDGEGVSRDILNSFLIEIRDPTEYGEDPLIDDPVTGAGNEDLWIIDPEDAPANEQCESDEPECEAEPAE